MENNYRKTWENKENLDDSDYMEEVEQEGEGESEIDETPNHHFLFDYAIRHFVHQFKEFDLHPNKPKIEYWQKALNPDKFLTKEEISVLRKGVLEK